MSIEKPPPTVMPTPSYVRPSYGYGRDRSQASSNRRGESQIDNIIEEVVEHDIEEELGKKLNISMVGPTAVIFHQLNM